MVLMRVADQYAQQVRACLGEPGDRRNRGGRFVVSNVERPAKIEQDATAAGLDLDAGPADLFGAPVDAEPHRRTPEPPASVESTTSTSPRSRLRDPAVAVAEVP